jgi:hypothetical protein
VVTNGAGSATSATASLTVLAPPSIVADLTNQTVAAGSNVTFEVGVTGTSPVGYQWLFNGTNLVVGITNPLVLDNVASAQAGTYQVIMTNGVGSVTSSLANLVVMTPPNITKDLTNQTATPGSSVTLQVEVSGTAPITFQWLFNGAVLAGANGNSLFLSNIRGEPG